MLISANHANEGKCAILRYPATNLCLSDMAVRRSIEDEERLM